MYHGIANIILMSGYMIRIYCKTPFFGLIFTSANFSIYRFCESLYLGINIYITWNNIDTNENPICRNFFPVLNPHTWSLLSCFEMEIVKFSSGKRKLVCSNYRNIGQHYTWTFLQYFYTILSLWYKVCFSCDKFVEFWFVNFLWE